MRGCGPLVAVTRLAAAVENAIAKSPLPLEYVEPVRASANTARAASRFRSRASSGASVATTIMQDPSAVIAPPAGPPLGVSSRQTGTPAIVSRPPKFVCTSTPTVHDSFCCRTTRDDVPMPPFQPKAIVPVPAPTAPSSTGPVLRAVERRQHVIARHVESANVVERAVVRLADERR